MALPASGAISFNNINVELCRAGGAQLSLNDSCLRTLFGQASGAVCMNTGHGKTNTSVPGIPTSVSASATSSSAISVSFSAPACTGHLTIDSYQVVCTSSGSNSATGSSSPISVTGLSASTSYTFKVRAHNSKGYGCYSSTASATTQAPPYMCITTSGATVYTCGNFKIAVWTGSGSYTVNSLGATTNFGTNISAFTVSAGGGTGSLLGGGGGGSGSTLINCSTGAGGLTVTTGLKTVTVGAGGVANYRGGLGGNGCQTNMKYTSTCTTYGFSAGTGGIQSGGNDYGGTSGNGYGGGGDYVSCQSKYSDRENGGGAGGANGYGGTGNASSAGSGGAGLSVPSQFSSYYSSLTGLSSSGGGGGGASIYFNVSGSNSGGCAGSGGGGTGSRWNNYSILRYGTAGTAYSGGGAGACYTNSGRNGGGGVAMIRWRFQ